MTIGMAAGGHPLRVLVVDDEEMLRRLVASLLERDGHQVRMASSGDEAIELFAGAWALGEAFDVVVTDLSMPGTDGEVVATEVKRTSPTTPVILLTGFGFGKSGPPFDCVLGKPEGMRMLRQVVRELAALLPRASWTDEVAPRAVARQRA